jgi:RNA polymerase-binding protein DksA
MYYIVPTAKSVDDASRDLESAVQKHAFGVLHVYDLKETLTKKGFPLEPQCRIYEVCNPQHASQVLQRDIRVNMALPCRISVFEDHGTTKIGTVLPAEILRALSHDRELATVAETVQATIKSIIEDAAAPADSRTRLLRRRAVLEQEIRAGVEKRTAERDGNVPDSGELATERVARDVAMADIDRDAEELRAIDSALARLDQGTYGRCVECGAAIAEARLTHVPEAARCITCEQARDQRTGRPIARL